MTNNFNQLVNKPDLISVLQSLQTNTLSKLNCMKIGIVNKVISSTEVLCAITNKMLVKTNPDGTGVWKEYPLIYARVWFLGSGINGINHTITENTPVLMMFNDREMDSYFATGEISTLANTRTHSLNDCIAIPLYRPETASNGLDISGSVVNIGAGTININASTLNLTADTINITGTLIINGQPYLEHTHTNGNLGSPTGGVIT